MRNLIINIHASRESRMVFYRHYLSYNIDKFTQELIKHYFGSRTARDGWYDFLLLLEHI